MKLLRSGLLVLTVLWSVQFAKPPVLINQANSCWSNSFVWSMRNVRSMTEKLLNNKEKYKKNEFLGYYIDLLEAIQLAEKKNFEKEFDFGKFVLEKMEKFHKGSCPIITKELKEFGVDQKYGRTGDPQHLWFLLRKLAPDLIQEYFGAKSVGQDPVTVLTPPLEGDKDSILEELPQYIFEQTSSTKFKSMYQPPVNKSLSDQGLWPYDLIGSIILETKEGADHFYAYIKDQFEEEPKWYKCDDLGLGSYSGKIIEEISFPPELQSNEKIVTNLYKSIRPIKKTKKEEKKKQENGAALDILANSLQALGDS